SHHSDCFRVGDAPWIREPRPGFARRLRRRDAVGATGSTQRGTGRGTPGVSDAVFPPPILSRSGWHGMLGIRAVLAPQHSPEWHDSDIAKVGSEGETGKQVAACLG